MLISLDDAVARLKQGDVVALPTETVYGLAGLALVPDTVEKIYALKGRPANNPLIVHLPDRERAEEIAHFNDSASRLCDLFWPGPLTIVVPKKEVVPTLLTGGGNTVALRSPAHPVFRQILKELEQPLAAPSANPSNRTSPTRAEHVIELFGRKSPPVLDGGPCAMGLESTVIDLSDNQPRILRYGPVTPEMIEDALNTKDLSPSSSFKEVERTDASRPAKSPGTGSLHYSPETPLFLHESLSKVLYDKPDGANDLFIVPSEIEWRKKMEDLGLAYLAASEDGNLEDIARNLYDILIRADGMKASRLILLLPDASSGGLGLAIRDRLLRAGKVVND